MNEQEIMQKNAIEKREKTDTMIAYGLIVILSLCIIILLYLKFVRKEETPVIVDNPPVETNTTSLNIISRGLNNSDLVVKYNEKGETISSKVEENNLIITYTKDNEDKEYNIALEGDELEFNVEKDDTIIEDIYKEVAYVICSYSGVGNSVCRTAADTINESTSGIRIVEKDDSKLVYVSIKDTIVAAGSASNSTNTNSTSTATESTDKNSDSATSTNTNTGTSNSESKTETPKEETTSNS